MPGPFEEMDLTGLTAFATPKCASAALLTFLSNGLGPGLRTQLHMSTDPAQHSRSSLHQTIFSLVCQQVWSHGSSQTKKCMGAVLLSSCRHVQSMTNGDVVLPPQQFWGNQGSSLCLRSSICLSWSLPIFFWGLSFLTPRACFCQIPSMSMFQSYIVVWRERVSDTLLISLFPGWCPLMPRWC